jgi:hypothetical protein
VKILSIRVDNDLHRRLRHRSAAAHLSLSQLLRPLLEEAAWPSGRYVFTGQDELLGIAIQTFAIIAELAGAQSPSLLERGSHEARRLMRERGLLDPEITPVSGGDRSAEPLPRKRS